jgi:hypothetical protein
MLPPFSHHQSSNMTDWHSLKADNDGHHETAACWIIIVTTKQQSTISAYLQVSSTNIYRRSQTGYLNMAEFGHLNWLNRLMKKLAKIDIYFKKSVSWLGTFSGGNWIKLQNSWSWMPSRVLYMNESDSLIECLSLSSVELSLPFLDSVRTSQEIIRWMSNKVHINKVVSAKMSTSMIKPVFLLRPFSFGNNLWSFCEASLCVYVKRIRNELSPCLVFCTN